jgi:hypothetical protein
LGRILAGWRHGKSADADEWLLSEERNTKVFRRMKTMEELKTREVGKRVL